MLHGGGPKGAKKCHVFYEYIQCKLSKNGKTVRWTESLQVTSNLWQKKDQLAAAVS